MIQQFRASLLTLALLAPFVSALAQAPAPAARPDFNGTWTIDLARSEFSPAPQPSAQTETITVTADTLTVAFVSQAEDGKQKYIYSLKFDAQDIPFPKPELNETELNMVSAKAAWKDSSIVVLQNITYQNGPGTIEATYTLSPDGKVLTKMLDVSLDVGHFVLKAVYNRA
jgi:hypothetical protein